MRVTEAFIELTPRLATGAAARLRQEVAVLGRQLGALLPERIGEGLDRSSPVLDRSATRAAKTLEDKLNDRLRKLNLEPIDFKVNHPTAVLQDIDIVERRLRDLNGDSATAEIKIETNQALAQIKRLRKQLVDEGEETGRETGKAIADTLSDRLRRLNLPQVDVKANNRQAVDQIEDVRLKLLELSRKGATVEIRADAKQALADLRTIDTRINDESGRTGDRAGRNLGLRMIKSLEHTFGTYDFNIDTGAFGRALIGISARFSAVATGAIAAAPAVANLTASLAPLLGLSVGAPAILGGLVFSIGTLITGIAPLKQQLKDLGDAQKDAGKDAKAYNEALEKVPTNLRPVITKMLEAGSGAQGITEELVRLGLVDPAKDLTPTFKNMLEKLSDLKTEANQSGAVLNQMLQEPFMAGARAVDLFKDAWHSLTALTQAKLFATAEEDMQTLISNTFPTTRKGLEDTASAWSEVGHKAAEASGNTKFLQGVRDLTDATAAGTRNWALAMDPLANIFGVLFTAAAPLLERMVTNTAGLVIRFSEFLTKAQESGQLGTWLENGVTTLGKVWDLITNVSSAFGSFIFASNRDGKNLLDTLVGWSGSLAEFLKSAEGKEALDRFFDTADKIGTVFRDVFQAALPIVKGLMEDLGPIFEHLGEKAGDYMKAFGPVVDAYGDIAKELAEAMLPQLDKLAAWMSDEKNQQAVRTFTTLYVDFKIATTGLRIATELLSKSMLSNPWVALGVGIGAAGAGIYKLYKDNEGFHEWVDKVGRSFQENFLDKWPKVGASFRDHFLKPLDDGWRDVNDWTEKAGRKVGEAGDKFGAWTQRVGEKLAAFPGQINEKMMEAIRAIWLGAKDAWDAAEAFGKNVLTAIGNFLGNIGNNVAGWMGGAISSVASAAHDVWDHAISFGKNLANGVISGINWIINKWNGFEIGFKTPDWSWLPDFMRNKTVNFETPNISPIPYLADGGHVLRSGLSMVGERGPEILDLPSGATVRPLDNLGGSSVTKKLDELISIMKNSTRGPIANELHLHDEVDLNTLIQRIPATEGL